MKTVGKQSFLFIVFLHAILAGGSYFAYESGEDQEEKVEKVVNEEAIEHHEEKGETFKYVAIVVFLLSIGVYFLPISPLFEGAVLVLLLLQFILGYLGYEVGHSGGELVYKHGAASAYTKNIGDSRYGKNQHRDFEEHEDDD